MFRPLPESDPLAREFTEIMKQIEAGQPMHPMEIWELVVQLREAGAIGWANRLAEHLPD
ncbi:hypothetical protein [Sphingobium sp. TCM1]|jgi:hypothetical protein|uniref:hypothetical protein n=1 Tax=Sphingobium sp. TCM1 TaxID=453246 RepID=UPI000A72DD58|nr:hypothetical protein [Sphingobium sp. TCM1]